MENIRYVSVDKIKHYLSKENTENTVKALKNYSDRVGYYNNYTLSEIKNFGEQGMCFFSGSIGERYVEMFKLLNFNNSENSFRVSSVKIDYNNNDVNIIFNNNVSVDKVTNAIYRFMNVDMFNKVMKILNKSLSIDSYHLPNVYVNIIREKLTPYIEVIDLNSFDDDMTLTDMLEDVQNKNREIIKENCDTFLKAEEYYKRKYFYVKDIDNDNEDGIFKVNNVFRNGANVIFSGILYKNRITPDGTNISIIKKELDTIYGKEVEYYDYDKINNNINNILEIRPMLKGK